MRTMILLILCTSCAIAQSVYEIPFPEGRGGLGGNVIELSILNSSTIAVEEVKVEVRSSPEGIRFDEKSVRLKNIKSKEEQTATFTFAVEKTVKVNKEQLLSFAITTKEGQSWAKEIRIKVAPPTVYKLYQNYPNPFNPSTVIGYELPAASNVSLRVYDILGREVENLLSEMQDEGYHQVTFDASRLSSGTYIYQLTVTDEQNKKQVFRKKMLLIR